MAMKLWLFERELEYYGYYGFLVRAETQEQAWNIILAEHKEDDIVDADNPWKCRQVTESGEAELVHKTWSSG